MSITQYKKELKVMNQDNDIKKTLKKMKIFLLLFLCRSIIKKSMQKFLKNLEGCESSV